ncbi:hypothetical protein T35B1_17401 [Salinisphaera shabanensis T35B1]|uniref:antitoxin Xre/MbcA/ParS toxin-binding domain-containing protein n=1 Tax=Salinisphaera shabanensis TaxID=180542 RepID=UPI003341B9E0
MQTNNELSRSERALALLGGERFVRLSARELDDPAMVWRMILAGVPVNSAQHLREHSGLPRRLFDQVVCRTSLISAGKSKSQRLSKSMSEAIVRTAKIIALAEQAFGDRERAMYWLNTPNAIFEEKAPITLIDTGSGTEWVKQVLVRMMYGIDA